MERGYLIGVDIGGTKCAVVLGDRAARIFDRLAFPTETAQGSQPTVDRILRSVEELLERNGVRPEEWEAVGVSCGGPLDSRKGIIHSPPNLPGWDEVPIVGILEKRFRKKAHLQNDANACAVAEWRFGAGKGCRNMVFLTFGTGMGAGIILNGRLYSGTNDMAGEVGHIRLAEDGPIGYGKRGSFEGFCSGGGVAQLAQAEILKKLDAGEKVGFCSSRDAVPSITTKDIGDAAACGDPFAAEILRTSGRYLGMGLSILIDILNPQRIIIGSVFVRCREFLQPAAEEIIRKEALAISSKVCTILPAGLGERIGDYASLSVALGTEGV